MRLFIDSARPEDWQPWAAQGFLYGVTTNPILFERAGLTNDRLACGSLIAEAQRLALSEIQFQLWGLSDPAAAARRLNDLYELWPQGVVAKVPLTPEGFACLPHLDPAIPLTLTAAYAAEQSLLAAGKGARYIAPYYGRLLEATRPADTIVDQMLSTCRTGGHTRVLVASLRSADQVMALAARGFDTFTLTPTLFPALLSNELTAKAVDDFEQAAERITP